MVFLFSVIVGLHILLTSASPSMHHPQTHMGRLRARQGPDPASPAINDSPLPPVALVFQKMMAAEHLHDADSVERPKGQASPAADPQALTIPPAPTIPAQEFDIALASTTAMEQAAATPYLGPGPVIPQSSIVFEDILSETSPSIEPYVSSVNPTQGLGAAPAMNHSTDSATKPSETGNILDAAQPTPTSATSHRTPGPARKLIIIGAVMAGLIVLMFLAYVALNRRLLALCFGKKEEERDTWTKIDSPPLGTYNGSEKDIAYSNSRSLCSESVYSTHGTASASASNAPLTTSGPARVIDISSNELRSKWSLCSSDFAPSISSESAARTDPAVLDSPHRWQYEQYGQYQGSPYLPAYGDVYFQPPEPFEDARHSRINSEPTVSHVVPGAPSELMVRAIQHRRSRSVSGLTYTVKPRPQRESELSAADWGSSPQSPAGWP
ncbi:hypothetical protein H0H92_002759, partial [Tricholoma furcatifolium]